MEWRGYRFDRSEVAGSLGDLGTLIPLSLALIAINGMSFTPIFLLVGLFYIVAGLYFKLPVPIQPLKIVAAVAVALPGMITLPILSAAGLLIGAILLVLAVTGLVDQVSRLFAKPVIRGIQLGLGFVLMTKGTAFISSPELFLSGEGKAAAAGIPLNPIVGLAAGFLTLFLLSSRRFPATLVVVGLGVIFGAFFGAFRHVSWNLGPTSIGFYSPDLEEYRTALILLVIPQIPLTLANAAIGTSETAKDLWGEGEAIRRATPRRFAISMGVANMIAGFLAAMPMCHGAGGLAAHYRFGARTGGSNVVIGAVFVMMVLFFGRLGESILGAAPKAILGVLLLFAGLELALLVRDVLDRKSLFVAFLVAGVGLSTSNMSIAVVVGIVVHHLLVRVKANV